MEDYLVFPEKRTEILYCRISPSNKKYISKAAEYRNISESALIDHIITLCKDKNASNKKPAKKRSI